MAEITFDQYKIDLITQACKRLLAEFDPSRKGIQPFINALVQQTQDWNDITQTVFSGRFVDNAVGVQLDIIGDIIGQARPFLDGDNITYFKWDAGSTTQGWDGTAGWFVENAPDSGLVPANDLIYRNFIFGKIFKNQVTGASIPEILQFINLTFKLDASVFKIPGEPMAISIGVPANVSSTVIRFLNTFITDTTIEKDYFVPIANGVRLAGVTLLPLTGVFGFDDGLAPLLGWDSGKWALTVL